MARLSLRCNNAGVSGSGRSTALALDAARRAGRVMAGPALGGGSVGEVELGGCGIASGVGDGHRSGPVEKVGQLRVDQGESLRPVQGCDS
jgi:hypothetical protein